MNHILTLNPVNLHLLNIRWRFSLRTWLISSFVLVVFLLGFYIFQVNEVTKAGFFISNHEKQIAEFSQESQVLSADFTILNSLANLETILAEMNYEAVGQVHYLRVSGTTVVAK